MFRASYGPPATILALVIFPERLDSVNKVVEEDAGLEGGRATQVGVNVPEGVDGVEFTHFFVLRLVLLLDCVLVLLCVR